MNKNFSIVPAIAAAMVLAACSSTPTTTSTPAPVTDTTQRPTPPTATTPGPTTSTVTPARPMLIEPLAQGVLAGRSVYFDYDSNAVKDDAQTLVQAHAKFMMENSGSRIALEGNTDERGSREYNLSLGQRRADAVKQVMTVVGVQAARIETVSFGEEKPKSPGHDEAAWKQNRRADIVYKK